MITNPYTLAFRAVASMLLAFASAQACGPDFSPDIFVRPNRPDLPREYPAGKLGLLQTSFARFDLMVAYRYLSGGTLNAEEQKAWSPSYNDFEPEWGQQQDQRNGVQPEGSSPTPLDQWAQARDRYPDPPPGQVGELRKITGTYPGGSVEASILNCPDDAFRNALATLAARASQWGSSSPALRDWLRGQDTVFANCSGNAGLPQPAPAGSPALLLSDRAYQTAAASFYRLDLATATRQFQAIASDKSSPWQPIAGYLAARSLVRNAFLTAPLGVSQASYDPALMHSAAAELRGYLAGNPPPSFRKAAEAKLAFVRVRIEPEARGRELASLVAGSGTASGHDPNYAQDATDLLWLLNPQTSPGLLSKLAASSPLIDWLSTMRSSSPDSASHALAEWQRTHTLPWLVAALTVAPEQAAPSALLAAAAAVPTDSPAWQTVTYHRVRLLIAADNAAEARSVLAGALPTVQQQAEPSSVNAFRGLAMLAAPDLAGFLAYAPRSMLLTTSEAHWAVEECLAVMKNPDRHYNCAATVSPEQLDADAARVLNTQAPLSVWLQAAQAGNLSPQLRQAIAMAGWARATLLHDGLHAAAFLPLLPDSLRAEAGQPAIFPALLTLAQNPGLNPNLNDGTQRNYSYDFVESYRDNWCYRTGGSSEYQNPHPPTERSRPAFLSAEAATAGAKEAGALAAVSAGTLGEQIISYVRDHPDEPRAAEALYLVLRMVRYGCTEPAPPPSGAPITQTVDAPSPQSDESERLLRDKQDAARLLRERYQKSPWTKKAASIAG